MATVTKQATQPSTYAISKDQSGVMHAFSFTGAKRSFCGWRRHNFNKVYSTKAREWGDGCRYNPPGWLMVTCIACLGRTF